MVQVLSVTHYLQDVHDNRDLTAYSDTERPKLQAKLNDFSFVIQGDAQDTVNDVLTRKINLVKKIRAEHDSEDIALTAALFAPFVDKYKQLHKVYTVSLQSHKYAIASGSQKYDENVLLEIADKMIMAAVFEVAIFRERHVYQEQLKVLEQVLFDISLKKEGAKNTEHIFDPKSLGLNLFASNIPKPSSFAANLRSTHNNWNIGRFFILRAWRSITKHFTVALAKCKTFMDGLNVAKENGLGGFFSFVSWVFFIPRLIVNLCTVSYSLIGTLPIFAKLKLPQLENEYGWLRRLKMRLNAIGFEIANDLMWFTSGIINCFSLAGSLPIIGVYIMVAAQAYDFFVMAIRNFVDRGTLNATNKDLIRIQQQYGLKDSTHLLDNLKIRIEFDKKVLLYALFNFVLLLMCISLMTPAFGAISPFIPLVAGIITVIIAPFRGVYIHKFRNEAKKFDPPLVSGSKAGFVTLQNDEDGKFTSDEDIKGYCASNNLFGVYSKGLLLVKAHKDSIIQYEQSRLYLFKKGAEPALREVNSADLEELAGEISKLDSSLDIGERVRSISHNEYAQFVKGNESHDSSIGYIGRQISSVMGFGV